jgi:hypothetical protein
LHILLLFVSEPGAS